MGLLTHLFSYIKEIKERDEFNKQLREDGLKIAIDRCIKEINKSIFSKEIAIKFVLQELDFAQKEKTLPPEFISGSGFHQLEYQDAINRFKEDASQLVTAQNLFDKLLRKIKNEEEMIKTSIDILEKTMLQWEIGKYSPARTENQEQESKTKENHQSDISKEEIKEPKPIQYDSKRVNHLMEEYSDIIGDIITGRENSNEEERIKEFKEHISLASIEGHSHHAVVLSCFYKHKEPYKSKSPIKVSEMSEISLNFLRSILKGFSQQGFSQVFLKYAEENSKEIYDLTKM